MTTLAYAEGQGLPWDNIWAPLASALAGRKYRDEDIRWLLEAVGSFIIETLENWRSVYRLYHQVLRDFVRRHRRLQTVQNVFVKVLIASVPRHLVTGGPDWLLASQYIRAHLPIHAAAYSKLDDLPGDPLFLLAADPEGLLAVIDLARTPGAQTTTEVYERTVHLMQDQPLKIAASYLEYAAHLDGAVSLAAKLAEVPLRRSWRTVWAI